jgi:hypothetical protein
METYVAKHFIDFETFVRRCGGSADQVEALLAAKAAPGVIYSQSQDGFWWSALAGYVGASDASPPAGGTDWYAPSAVWWVRRAILTSRAGMDPQGAANLNQDTFIEQFFEALTSVAHAKLNYPICFENETLATNAARQVALKEWEGWVSGAYAVCLAAFSGESCVRKEVYAWRIRNHHDNSDASLLLSSTELFDLTEQLASLLMPFAPFERSSGTPGKAIDRTLAALNVGIEEPYA